jgi:hypothetical protein
MSLNNSTAGVSTSTLTGRLDRDWVGLGDLGALLSGMATLTVIVAAVSASLFLLIKGLHTSNLPPEAVAGIIGLIVILSLMVFLVSHLDPGLSLR